MNSVSWPYGDLPGRVADMIGHRPRRLSHGPVGGETPVRLLHEAALRIAHGESEVAAICGGEAEHSVQQARKMGTSLPWTAPDPSWTSPRVRHYLHPLALRHGLSQPIFVYPLYETACQAAWGQTPSEGQAELAALWSSLSVVAAQNQSRGSDAGTSRRRSRRSPRRIGPSPGPIRSSWSRIQSSTKAAQSS